MPRTHRPRYAPKQLLAPPRLRAYALRALARRGHSVDELRRKLNYRAAPDADVEALLKDLESAGWLDDPRFARDFARARSRRYGRRRIAAELRMRGIPDALASQALDEIFPTPESEIALLRQRLDKRLARRKSPDSSKLLRSVYAALLRAGFPSAIIRDELFRRPEFRRDKNSFPNSPEGDAEAAP